VGGFIAIIVLLLVLPVLVILTLTVVAGALGWFLKDDVDTAYADTEHVDLGK
jgi:hypothetical protein